MKKFGKTLLLFIPFAAVLYAILLIIFAAIIPGSYIKNVFTLSGHVTKRLDDVRETKNVDILFLGSSHAYRSFDIRMYNQAGLKGFVLGSPAQTPIQTEYLLEQYLDSLKPKLVVYEVYPVTFSIDGTEASLYLIASEKVNKGIFDMALEQNSIVIYNTMLLSFLEQKFNLNIKTIENPKNERYIKGGFVEADLRYFDKTPRHKEDLKFMESQFKLFEKNLALLKKRNIKYILVQAPYPKSTYNAFTNLDSFDKRMSKYGPYYNFNESMDLDDSIDFLDDSHLNQNGVAAFNKQLLDTLKTIHYNGIRKLMTSN